MDLVACSVCLPFEITDIIKSYTFYSGGACKFFRFLIHFVSLASGFMLVLIAFERYRKICTPFGRQLVAHEIRIACIVVIVLSFVLSIPSFIFYGSALKNSDFAGFEHVTGYDCTTLPKYKYAFLYLGLMLIISTIMFIACVIMYSIVGKALYRHYSKRTNKTDYSAANIHHDNTPSSQNESSVVIETPISTPKKAVSMETMSMSNTGTNSSLQKSVLTKLLSMSLKSKSSTLDNNTLDRKAQRAKIRLDRTMHITLMLLVATLISYLGYIPTIVTGILNSVDKSTADAMDASLGTVTAILTRGFYLNHVVNPIVFFFMDKKMRKDAKRMYKNVCKTRSKKCVL